MERRVFLPQDADGSAERALQAGMATLDAAEARLRAARGQLDALTATALARLVMDVSAALLLVRALAAGEISADLFRREGARLALTVPASLMERLPAAARLGALELVTLAAGLEGLIAHAHAGAASSAGAASARAQREKPRRRQGRPRLRVVPDAGFPPDRPPPG